MPYYIAFDLSHKPRGKIDENLTKLRDHLNANDFTCFNILEAPISQEHLKPYDILVFACPDFSKFSNQEIIEITNWVKEDGGGLLMLSHAGGDKGRNSNLGELSVQFGIAFESDQVLDEINNMGVENMPIITADHFIPPHPITNGIDEICYRAGCSLTVLGGAISIVSSNETSDPFSSPLICTAEPENGRVTAIGSYEIFRDETRGGFQNDDHIQLALNIFNWLVSDYRMELTQQGTDHSKSTIPISISSNSDQLAEQYTTPVSSGPVSDDLENIDFSMKISSKSELIEQLKMFLNQVTTIKYTIEHLIQATLNANDDIFKKPQEPIDLQDYTDFLEFNQRPLTDLPPKPSELGKNDDERQKSDDLFIGLEPITPAEIEKTTKTIPKSYIKETSKGLGKQGQSSGKLKAELDGLESKLNSVFNLINFIEKKHKAGKLDDKSYKRQTKKLQKDLDQTKKRIEEIKKILG